MYEVVFRSSADVHVEFWDYTVHRPVTCSGPWGENTARTMMEKLSKH